MTTKLLRVPHVTDTTSLADAVNALIDAVNAQSELIAELFDKQQPVYAPLTPMYPVVYTSYHPRQP